MLTPGTIQHHLLVDRVRGCLLEGSHREYIGVRGAARGHRQRWSAEPEHGLVLSIAVDPVLRTTSRTRLKPPFDQLHDSHIGHATLTANVLAHLLQLPELPLFVFAYQNWKRSFAPVQCHRLARDPELAPQFLTHLKDAYRYDLSQFESSLEQRACNQPSAAATFVREAYRPVHPAVPAVSREPAPLFNR